MLQEVPKYKEDQPQESLKTIYQYINKLKQELEYQLLNLDKDNMTGEAIKSLGLDALGLINQTYFDDNGVWTPQVYANNINALHGKITTAQIEKLEVGGNVTMAPGAIIEWGNLPGNVAATGDIPDVPGYITSTKITQTTIESPTIRGGSVEGTRFIQESLFNSTGNLSLQEGGIHFMDKAGKSIGDIYADIATNAIVVKGKLTDEKGEDIGGTAVFG